LLGVPDYNVAAMPCHCRRLCLAALFTVFVLANCAYSSAQNPEQYLRDHYSGKTLVLRGFYSADHLRYDSSGRPDKSDTGDWTEYGFVLIQEIHASDDRMKIKAERLVGDFSQKQFQLHPSEEQQLGKGRKPVFLKIEADFPQHNPSPQQVDALMSKVFLTAQDHIADAVPAYWKPCVPRGVAGQDKNCVFSAETLDVPGVAGSSQGNPEEVPPNSDTLRWNELPLLRVGKDVRPPKVVFQKDPEFSESARAAKFQGVVVLMCVVNKDGVPTHIRIANPLGYGLDAKAVEAVQSWQFQPATKDGEPVAVEIAVEVSFHLY
jgi:TonB family protein